MKLKIRIPRLIKIILVKYIFWELLASPEIISHNRLCFRLMQNFRFEFSFDLLKREKKALNAGVF